MPDLIYRSKDRKRLARQFSESVRDMPYVSLGFALYWMMTVLFLYSPFLFDAQNDEMFALPPVGTVTAIISVVVYFICAPQYKKFSALDGKKAFFPLLAAGMTLGAMSFSLAVSGAFSSDFSTFLSISGLALLGATTALACLEFGRIFALIGPRKVLFHGTIALLLGSIGALLVVPLPRLYASIVLALLPIPLVACIAKSAHVFPRARVFEQGTSEPAHVPRRFLVTSAIQGLCLGAMHNLLAGLTAESASLSALGFCIGAGLLLFTAIVIMQDFNTLFYRVGFPIMAAGFFVVGAFPGSLLAGSVFLDAGYCYQYLISCCLCAYLAKSLDQSPIWIIGTSTGCLLAGQLAGSALEFMVDDGTFVATALAFALPLSALYLYSTRNMVSGWGSIRPGDAEPVSDPSDEACRIIAGENGITKRELDVLVLLARGHTRKEISERLHLSEETIKTHTGKIYQKLAVHSKRELIALVEKQSDAMS